MKETVADTVLRVIGEATGAIHLTPGQMEEDLLALGMDSILFIRVVVALEEAFSIEIPDEYLLMTELNTASKIVDVISAQIGKTGGRGA
ncbi:MAG: acyl carrier protein [Hydrogeniiclostridium sp.]